MLTRFAIVHGRSGCCARGRGRLGSIRSKMRKFIRSSLGSNDGLNILCCSGRKSKADQETPRFPFSAELARYSDRLL